MDRLLENPGGPQDEFVISQTICLDVFFALHNIVSDLTYASLKKLLTEGGRAMAIEVLPSMQQCGCDTPALYIVRHHCIIDVWRAMRAAGIAA